MEFDLNANGGPMVRVKVDESTKGITLIRYFDNFQEINVVGHVELNEDEFKKLIKWAQSYFDENKQAVPVR